MIEPDGWDAARAFEALATDWRIVVSFGGAYFQGIEKTAIESTLRMMKIKANEQMINRLMLMQEAAKPILNKKTD